MGEGNQAVNWARAVEMADGDEELLHDLAAQFIEQSAAMVAALRAAVDARAQEQVAQTAHRLRGSLGIFQAQAAFDRVSDIERRARAGTLGDDAPLAIEGIDGLVADVRRELAARIRA